MNRGPQRVCIWCGPAMLVLWLVSFVVVARFIPPPNPSDSPEAIRELFTEHTDAVRFGLVLTMFASALLVPFGAAISAQMRRIEGRHHVLAGTQLASCALLSVEFIIPVLVWLTASFRPTALSLETVQLLNDMGWLMFMTIVSSAMVQVASIGYAMLVDARPEPIFPRWAGYFCLWVALLFTPGGFVVFFKHGAFAWNGLVAFWFVLIAFAAWVVTMTVLLLRAVDEQANEAPSAPRPQAATPVNVGSPS